jgi:antirestriction protein ArdC
MEASKEKNEKRAKLCVISTKARAIRQARAEKAETPEDQQFWAGCTLNYIIIQDFYKDEENQIFKTFKEWRKEGFQVRKGSKGFVVWGRKLKATDKKTAKKTGNSDDEREFKFFPISHVFSNNQVEELKN